jgi:hypothetical protein
VQDALKQLKLCKRQSRPLTTFDQSLTGVWEVVLVLFDAVQMLGCCS